MTERVSLEVALEDDITADAKKAAAALEKLSTAIEKTAEASEKKAKTSKAEKEMARQAKEAERYAKQEAKQAQALQAKQLRSQMVANKQADSLAIKQEKEAKRAADKAAKEAARIDKEQKAARAKRADLIKKALDANVKAQAKANDRQVKAHAVAQKQMVRDQTKAAKQQEKELRQSAKGGFLDDLAGGIPGMVFGAIKTAAMVAAGAVLAFGSAIAYSAGQSTILRERSIRAFQAMGGGGKQEFERIKRLSAEMNVSLADTASQMVMLQNFGFSRDMSTELFKRMQDMRALGSSEEQIGRMINAIAQVKSKGKLQSEELVGQLAEHGLGPAQVIPELERILGKNGEEVRRMLSSGEISGDVGVQAILAAAARKAGGGKAGELAKKNQGFGGALQSIQTRWSLFSNDISEKSAPAFDKLSKIILRLGSNSNAGLWADRIAAGLSWAVDMLEAAVPWVEQLIKDASSMNTEPFEMLADSLKEFARDKNNMQTFRDMAQALAVAAMFSAWLAADLIHLLNLLNRNKFTAYMLGSALKVMFLGPLAAIDLLIQSLNLLKSIMGQIGLTGPGGLLDFGAGKAGGPSMRATQPGDLGGISSLLNSVVNSSSGPKTSAASGPISINVSATGGSGDPQELAWKIAREVKTQLKNATASIGV